jgi:hypothetical protein
MAFLGSLGTAAWALSVVLQVCLLGLLVYRRNFLRFPVFTAYIVAAILQGAYFVYLYYFSHWDKAALSEAAWSVQGLVTLMRVAAIMELCHHVFIRYPGIRTMIFRALAICVLVVATLAFAFGQRALSLKLLYADRAVGLSLASAIVLLFLFARYYHVQPREPLQSMSIGFFLYSCFVVLNDSILEVFLYTYGALWNFLGLLSFTASLLLWCAVLRHAYEEWPTPPELLPAGIYHDVSSEVNLRLKLLDERLSRFLKRNRT